MKWRRWPRNDLKMFVRIIVNTHRQAAIVKIGRNNEKSKSKKSNSRKKKFQQKQQSHQKGKGGEKRFVDPPVG